MSQPKVTTKNHNQKSQPKVTTKSHNQKSQPKVTTKSQNQKSKPKVKTKSHNQSHNQSPIPIPNPNPQSQSPIPKPNSQSHSSLCNKPRYSFLSASSLNCSTTFFTILISVVTSDLSLFNLVQVSHSLSLIAHL